MTTDTIRTARVRWERYRADGRNLRTPTSTHLVDVTDLSRDADRDYLESTQADTLCGLALPDPWDAKIDTTPPGGRTCNRCAQALRKLRGSTDAEDVPSSASLRPRYPDRPQDLDTELGLYRRAAEIAERILEDGIVLTEARTVRLETDGLVAGELLLPRATAPDRAYGLGGELLRLIGALRRFEVSRDTTGRIRLVIAWDPFHTSTNPDRSPR